MDPGTDLGSLLTGAMPHTPGNGTSNHMINGSGNNNGSGRSSQTGQSQPSIASSLPDHYGAMEKASNFLAATQNLFTQKSEATNNASSSGLGPIARPRSYSTSASSHYTNNNSLAHNNPLGSGNFMTSYFNKLSSADDHHSMANNSSQPRKSSSGFFGGNSSPLFGNVASNSGAKNMYGSLFDASTYPNTSGTVESVVGSALDDLSIDDIHSQIEREAYPEKETGSNLNPIGDNNDNVSTRNLGSTSTLIGSTAPVNIPGSRSHRSNIGNLSPPMGASPLAASLGHHQIGVSPFARANSVATGTSASSFYDFVSGNDLSPSASQKHESASTVVQAAVSILEIQRLERELSQAKAALAKMANYEESIQQARNVSSFIVRRTFSILTH